MLTTPRRLKKESEREHQQRQKKTSFLSSSLKAKQKQSNSSHGSSSSSSPCCSAAAAGPFQPTPTSPHHLRDGPRELQVVRGRAARRAVPQGRFENWLFSKRKRKGKNGFATWRGQMRAEDAVLSVHLLLQVVKSDTLDAPEGSFGWFRGWKESKSEAFQFELDDAQQSPFDSLSSLISPTVLLLGRGAQRLGQIQRHRCAAFRVRQAGQAGKEEGEKREREG